MHLHDIMTGLIYLGLKGILGSPSRQFEIVLYRARKCLLRSTFKLGRQWIMDQIF